MNGRSCPTALAVTMALLTLGFSAPARAELPLLLNEDFENGAARWQPTDAAAWKILETPSGKVYSLFRQSDYKPPYRSPVNIAILKKMVVGDFELSARLQSTVKDYAHRSLVMVFGYQDPAHYYYVHFGKRTDDHANQIFIVNGSPRVKISTKTTPGTPWDDDWHEVQITRTTEDGKIDVYFDDMQNPAMTAVDKTFVWGQIGIGSFDDLGNFDQIVLRGRVVKPEAR
jgi:hypothetical protein